MNKYKDAFKYIAASKAWGLRVKDEVWIDHSATPVECVKLREAFGLDKNFWQQEGPWRIKFKACGQHPFFRSIKQDPMWVSIGGKYIHFKWYTDIRPGKGQILLGPGRAVTFEILEWETKVGYVVKRVVTVTHSKSTMSNKELVKLFLKTLIA